MHNISVCKSSTFVLSFTEHDPRVTIVVGNLPPDLPTDDLELYFESKKHSGGGAIVNTACKRAERKALIEFEKAEGMF